jgi:hypothetical protein
MREEDFDISLSENNLRTMKKVQYQNQLRKIYNEQQDKTSANEKDDKNHHLARNDHNLIHLDWACKLTNIREKFLPDFETLEKKNFHRIRE